MTSDGTVTLDAPLAEVGQTATGESDLAPAASQATSTASAPTSAAPAPATGANGSTAKDSSSSTTAGTAPTTPAADGTTPPAVDPLAGTEPFTYLVNGVAQTLDGVYRVPGEGLLVPEDKVAGLQQLMERAALSEASARDFQGRYAQVERLSEWKGPGSDGKERTWSGIDGLAMQQVHSARTAAELSVLSAIFTPDAQGNLSGLIKLLDVDPAGRITINPDAADGLRMRYQLQAQRAEQEVMQRIGQITQPTPTPAAEAPIDFKAAAPPLIAQSAQRAGVDASILTPADREALAKQLPFYTKGTVVDLGFTQVVADRVALRKEAMQQAKAAESATKHNAGMDRGRQPAPAAKPAPKPKDTPAPGGPRKKADWDSPFTTAMADLDMARS